MKAPYRLLAVREDLVLVLDRGIGRKAAILLGAAHRAPGGGEAQAQVGRRLELQRRYVLGKAIGIKVVMIGREGAARLGEFGHREH